MPRGRVSPLRILWLDTSRHFNLTHEEETHMPQFSRDEIEKAWKHRMHLQDTDDWEGRPVRRGNPPQGKGHESQAHEIGL